MNTKHLRFWVFIFFLSCIPRFYLSSEKSILWLPNKITLDHQEICFSDIGSFAKDWNIYDISRWEKTCFFKKQRYLEVKPDYFSLDEIELFLLENNFLFDKIVFNNSKNNVMQVEFALDKKRLFYVENDYKNFIQKSLPKYPFYEIKFLDQVLGEIPREAALSIYPLNPSKIEKTLQVTWPIDRGFIRKIVRFKFQIIYKENNFLD